MDQKEVPLTQRCPKCLKPTLQFDVDLKKLRCSSCGYEAFLPSVQPSKELME